MAKKLTTLCLLFVMCGFHVNARAQENSSTPDALSFAHENTIRKLATKVVMPVYPEAARRRGVGGLAVALVRVDDRGEVIKAEVLLAPDSSIGEAVLAAVRQWSFKLISQDQRALYGTLRFSFAVEGGEGRVGYGPLPRCQASGRRLPDGTVRRKLEDIDDVDCD